MSKNFQDLLEALNSVAGEADDLAKAVSQADADAGDEDENIAAAAAEAGAADAGAGAGAAADAGADAADDKDADMGKSFEFVAADGTKHKAVDATDLVKSLMERQTGAEETLAKAMETFTGVIQKQGELIKALSDKVSKLSTEGRGRKTMLTVVEKPDAGTLAKSEGAKDGMTVDQFFAKANTAFDQNKISGKELNVISVCLRGNHPIDPALITKVVSA